ncbi:MAG: DUF58 domain-containing protein [Desulfurococcaceae archaeon]
MNKRICEKAVAVSKLARAHFSSLMYGVVPSRVKGPGFEYIDLRDYSIGDDLRYIDWRASARMIKPDGDYRLMVKEFLLERMVNIVIILDYTSSMNYGDKIETSIYCLTGLLSIAHSLGDVVDLVIMKGSKPYLEYALDPLDAINIALNNICSSDPSGDHDLTKLTGLLDKLKNRESVFLITDYCHYPIELDVLLTRLSVLNTGFGAVFITTDFELKPPSVGGYFVFIDTEKPGRVIDMNIRDYYREVSKHVYRVKSILDRKRVDYIEVNGLNQAKIKKLHLLRLYTITRIRRRKT